MAVAQVLARLRHGPLGKENGSGINTTTRDELK